MTETYDYIIIGSGSAGSVLAARLSEDSPARVLLVEAGANRPDPRRHLPIAFYAMLKDPALLWGNTSTAQAGAGGRSFPLPRGKLLGGTGAINGMTYSRGDWADYDGWAAAGCDGWAAKDVLPYFKKSERNWRGETAYHGGSGPVSVVRANWEQDAFAQAFFEAAEALGEIRNEDNAGASSEGFSTVEFTITPRGRRASAAEAYLAPARRRPNLTIATGALATRILLEKTTARGIAYVQQGRENIVYANREVILCGGAYNSPQLLMLSGIGDPALLQAAGVRPLHALPGVGANLQDHAVVSQTFQAYPGKSFSHALRLDRFAGALASWFCFGTGPLSRLPISAWAFRKTMPGLDRPDMQFFFTALSLDAKLWLPFLAPPGNDIVTARSVVRYPHSRGTVRLKSADFRDAPLVNFNLLSDPEDAAVLVRALRQVRALMAQPALAALVAGELAPGTATLEDAELEQYIRQNARPACHPSGTCAMGTGADAVVDPFLRVHGIDRLRVADASIMPRIVGGNLNAPTMMIAEKAADMARLQSGAPASAAAPEAAVA